MGVPAPRHWYPTLMVVMCIKLLLGAALSFRAIPKSIHIMFAEFSVLQKVKIPKSKTVLRWLVKVGLYKLQALKEQATDWALIIDNSIQLGSQKCLVILGIRLSELPGKALTLEDMHMISIEIHEEGNAEVVSKALERAREKVGNVKIVCADDGPDLRGGIEIFCEKYKVGRTFDIVHKAATYLKKILNDLDLWENFTKAAAESKKKMQQSKAAHLAPPNQRTKSRFMNIEILVNWATDAIKVLETSNHTDRNLLLTYCPWLPEIKVFIESLKQLVLVTQTTRNYIREKGYHFKAAEELEALLEVLPLDCCQATQYAGQLIDFVAESSSPVPWSEVWLGSTEILESLFGKVKHLEQDQSKGGFTSLILGAAACVGKVDVDTIANAMQMIKTRDVEAWVKEWIGTTLTSKRRAAFGGWRKKRKKTAELKAAGEHMEPAVGF